MSNCSVMQKVVDSSLEKLETIVKLAALFVAPILNEYGRCKGIINRECLIVIFVCFVGFRLVWCSTVFSILITFKCLNSDKQSSYERYLLATISLWLTTRQIIHQDFFEILTFVFAFSIIWSSQYSLFSSGKTSV